jgi:putative endonuclease
VRLAIALPWKRIPAARLGRIGERHAAWYYRLRGYRILARNFRTRSGEADLVVRRGRTIAIVEVKTRQTLTAGEGHDAVTRAKRERLARIGDLLAARHPDAMLRYDILVLFWNGWYFRATRYRDAFRLFADARRPWVWRV